jgi:hypothetical protein
LGRSDRAIARALRHGVGHDGRSCHSWRCRGWPTMIRPSSRICVSSRLCESGAAHPTPLGGREATVLANPVGPAAPALPGHPGRLGETGRYLASRSRCAGVPHWRCQMTGTLSDPRFGDHGLHRRDDREHSWSRRASRAIQGRVVSMNEDGFVARFRRAASGLAHAWQAFSRLGGDDLRAISLSKSVPPVSVSGRPW